MATGNSIKEQWSAEPIKLKSDNPCGVIKPTFPNVECTREKEHKGQHCHEKQAGIKIVTIWW